MTAPAPGPEMSPDESYALLLAELNLGEYRPGDPTGSIFLLGVPPDTPHTALAVAVYGGDVPDAQLAYSDHAWQVRVRSAPHASVEGSRLAYRVHDTVLGLGRRRLPDGTELVPPVTTAQGAPVYIGQDDRGCHEWTVNVSNETRRRTRNRR